MGMKFARSGKHGLWGLAVAAAALVSAHAGPTWAKRNGQTAEDCSGCHASINQPQVTLELPGETMQADETITVSVTVSGSGSAGVYLWADAAGTFTLRNGEGLRMADDAVTHARPKATSGGSATFRVDWAPMESASGVLFSAAAVSANGDGRRTGDSAGVSRSSIAIGCNNATRVYQDQDGDGFGKITDKEGRLVCSPPAGFATKAGDCNDNFDKIFPGANELCNELDDDCDGETDEGLPIELLFEDDDGDGHGRPGSPSKMACGPQNGWGVGGDDCNDDDADINPDADELCNQIDDDCDGRVDEGARATCGIGWCRRTSPTCDDNLCEPGAPRDELCNLLDDDCDGETDEDDDLCPEGQACVEGDCIAGDDDDDDSSDDDDDDDDDDDSSDDDDDDDDAESSGSSGGCNTANTPPVTGIAPFIVALGALGLLRIRRRLSQR